jgi:SAM-dependent methyltransferase
MENSDDNWAEGASYEGFMGRWSRMVASAFIRWLDAEPGLRWLDVGCGTGALSKAVLQTADPALVIGCDPSKPFITYAAAQNRDPRLSFEVATLEKLPQASIGFGVIVSGLVLNFIPDPVEAVKAMIRRVSPSGLVAAYVWDYAGRMDFLRIFWDVAVAQNAAAGPLDEGGRFPLCKPERLASTFQEAGLSRVTTDAIDIPILFTTFSDYWEPFLAGTGPAPNYVTALSNSQRNQLATALKHRLEPVGGGKIEMIARAWAVRGEVGNNPFNTA